jgi:IS5 family transposase
VIGHLKNDGHLGQNFLKGCADDHANAVLSAVGYNFRLILACLRLLLRLIVASLASLAQGFAPLPLLQSAP